MYSAPSLSPHVQTLLERFLQRNTVVRAVLEKQSTINLAFVQVALLVSVVHDIRGSRGLLENTNLELPSTGQVSSNRALDGLERILADGVVDRYLAVCMSVSCSC